MFIPRFLPRHRAGSFGSNNTGTAGIEFALIAPVILVMVMGAVEYSRAVLMSRRFNLVTATLGDLVARDDFETDTTFTGLQHAVETIWSPYSKVSLELQVVDVRQSSTTTTKMTPSTNYVYWAREMKVDSGASPAASYTKCDLYPGLPAGMLSPGTSTIVVNAKYTFHSLFGVQVGGLSTSTQNWTSSSSHSPRGLCVGDGSANCTSTCE